MESTKAVSHLEKLLFNLEYDMEQFLSSVNGILWGIPVLILIITVGVVFTARSRFSQFSLLPQALLHLVRSVKKSKSEAAPNTGYRALCTALAATVGTGNIAGVAGAIAIGGPGVIFWMWICALLGMVTKLAEVTMALHYREALNDGNYIGGPMYMIAKGLPSKYRFLSYIYCAFGVFAAFGVGNATQINAVIDSAKSIARLYCYEFAATDALILAGGIAIFIAIAFRNGAGKIGQWAEKLVPIASVLYIIMVMGILWCCRYRIPTAFSLIITGAFSPKSVTGGIIGSIFITIRVGASRGVFTNEAGMGTASIAHASADVNHPIEQGLMGIVEVFLDTIILCTLSGLVILCTNIPIPYGSDSGITLMLEAFSCIYGNGSKVILSVLVGIFAFATILGWGLYGARCLQYLFGENAWKFFVLAQIICILISATIKTSIIWTLAEIVNGLMAIPNLIALFYLLPEFLRLLEDYKMKRKAYRFH